MLLLMALKGCGNATLVSALNSVDSGTTNMLSSFWQLPNDIIIAAFGNPVPNTTTYDLVMNIDGIRSQIPPIGTGSIIGSADCLAACAAGKTYSGS